MACKRILRDSKNSLRCSMLTTTPCTLPTTTSTQAVEVQRWARGGTTRCQEHGRALPCPPELLGPSQWTHLGTLGVQSDQSGLHLDRQGHGGGRRVVGVLRLEKAGSACAGTTFSSMRTAIHKRSSQLVAQEKRAPSCGGILHPSGRHSLWKGRVNERGG